MNPGKVAIFIPDLDGGGAQLANVNLANELVRQGLTVDFVVYNADGPFRQRVAENVRLVVLGSRRFDTGVLRFCRYLARERPSVVMASMQHAGVIALLARRLVGGQSRFIVQHQNTLSMQYQDARPVARLWLRLLGALLPSANAIVMVSNEAADDLVGMFPKTSHKVVSIYNPAFEPGIVELANEPLAHPWFNNSEVPVILSVGRLVPQKNYETLLAAFAQVVRSRQARLVVIGEGPDRASLLARAKELDIVQFVDFPGFQPNPYPFMKNANLFVLSSIFEGLPLVLVEALGCGTPVVSTACPGTREVLEDSKWGKLVPVEDAQAMARAILNSLDEPVDSTALVERANRFSARSIAEEYVKKVFFPDSSGNEGAA